jgi:hypothetical protein
MSLISSFQVEELINVLLMSASFLILFITGLIGEPPQVIKWRESGILVYKGTEIAKGRRKWN